MTSKVLLVVGLLPVLVLSTSCSNAQKEKEAQVEFKKASERRAYLGVSLQDMSQERAREMKVKTQTGALVNGVEEESPAEAAGIKEDDIIVEFNGKSVEDAGDLVRAVRKSKPDETASVVVMRKDEKKTLQAKLGKAPKVPDIPSMALIRPHVPSGSLPHLRLLTEYGSGAYGLEIMTLNKQLGEYFGAPDHKGVLVESVEKKSVAEKAGFKAGDVIVKIGQDRITDTRDVRSALEDYKEGDKVSVEILRKGSASTLTLEAEGQEETGALFRHQSFPSTNEKEFFLQFNNKDFQGHMEEFRQQMKTMTRKLREEARTIGEKVRQEVMCFVGV
jgi:membrane-associated protease RseP (regulator of RpoE activity)